MRFCQGMKYQHHVVTLGKFHKMQYVTFLFLTSSRQSKNKCILQEKVTDIPKYSVHLFIENNPTDMCPCVTFISTGNTYDVRESLDLVKATVKFILFQSRGDICYIVFFPMWAPSLDSTYKHIQQAHIHTPYAPVLNHTNEYIHQLPPKNSEHHNYKLHIEKTVCLSDKRITKYNQNVQSKQFICDYIPYNTVCKQCRILSFKDIVIKPATFHAWTIYIYCSLLVL